MKDAAKCLLIVALLVGLIYGIGTAGLEEQRRERARCKPVSDAFEQALQNRNAELAAQWATIAAQVSCSSHLARELKQ